MIEASGQASECKALKVEAEVPLSALVGLSTGLYVVVRGRIPDTAVVGVRAATGASLSLSSGTAGYCKVPGGSS